MVTTSRPKKTPKKQKTWTDFIQNLESDCLDDGPQN